MTRKARKALPMTASRLSRSDLWVEVFEFYACVDCGVGFHHRGLLPETRHA